MKKILNGFKSVWSEGKTLTLSELKQEAYLSELRTKQLLEIAKSNAYNERLWDNVFKESTRLKNLKNQIKQLEENKQ